MTAHKAHLNKEPFELVSNGQKTIEARLYDERRQRIDIGDTIVFTRVGTKNTVTVRVTHLHRSPTFHELYAANDPKKFGGHTAEELERTIGKFYSYDDQLKYGALGIEFVLV